ncbi:polysaccharide deacetylase family protein [Nocardia sp. NPDC050697]|uniref:polysaccharide deacetylase family protein n=1 Tax=Nocardia sp. NPDC050697 TaxID=3155158 RepID=UPI0033E9BC2D
MERRHFLAMLAAGAVAASGCTQPPPALAEPPSGAAGPAAVPIPPRPVHRVPIPAGALTAIPGPGSNLALTVDDGADPDVVGAYIRFARDTGARFTFFVTAAFEAWHTHRAALRPLVESGQIQLGNHTWDHAGLTTISRTAMAEQFTRSKQFLLDTYGVDGTPFYRPPFGYHNAVVDEVAADHGYAVPTLWYGSLADSGLITEEHLLKCARTYFTAQAIVIGHANHPPVTRVYGQLLDIIRERGLSLVTLNDVFRT